jgi:Ulp1 family protease
MQPAFQPGTPYSLRKLSHQEINRINHHLHCFHLPPSTIVARTSTTTIQLQSLQTLHLQTWINDEVINFYLLLLNQRDEFIAWKHGRPRSHCFSSFFMTSFLSDTDTYQFHLVQRWANHVPGKNIFTLELLVFPINISNNHWTCVIAYMQTKQLHYHDSSAGSGDLYLNAVMQYIKYQYPINHNGHPFPEDELWHLQPADSSTTPQQIGNTDCGAFLCAIVECFLRYETPHFTHAQLQGIRQHLALSILEAHALPL